MTGRTPLAHRLRPLALAVVVGVVLADSSIVILALPAILDQFRVDIPDVAWVLTSFNLVLALCAVPAAYAARRLPRPLLIGGLVVFAAASAACALADGLTLLIVARCVQAVGGAAVVCAALELMPALVESARSGVRLWAVAGAVGLAVGPALGGALTQLLHWRVIFVAQVPVLLALALLWRVEVRPDRGRAGPPRLAPNLALALVSAALTAALFLLVLLMINGWAMEPLAAALAASVMPVAAVAAGRLRVLAVGPVARAATGAVATAAGVAALGLMPGTSFAWTIVPQVFVGLGLGLAVGALTELAVAGLPQQAIHGGWTVAARHIGVVGGILILTPLFVADFDRQQVAGQDAVMAVMLDAPVDLTTKLALMREGIVVVRDARERIPDLSPVFDSVRPGADDRVDYGALEATIDEQLRRASSSAVMRSFVVAAAFALLALIPIGFGRLRERS